MAIQTINLGTAPTGTGGDTQRAANTKINQNFTDQDNAASRLVGGNLGNVMQVGAFGLGNISIRDYGAVLDSSADKTGFYKSGDHIAIYAQWNQNLYAWGLKVNGLSLYHTEWLQGQEVRSSLVYTTLNTNKGPNGELSEKSPVTALYGDRLEHTGDELELQPIEFVKKGVGHYLLKNTTGLAKEGWYIIVPKDANGNPVVAVEYEDKGGDVTVRTYKRKFDFEKAAVVADHDNPMDIPETRWINLRFNDKPELYKKSEA